MEKKTNIWGNLIMWIVVIGLLVFAGIYNKDFVVDSFQEVRQIPMRAVMLCILFSNLYFVAEAIIISRMTVTCGNRLTFLQGLSCAYMCAFYRLATFGSGVGIAQLFYYNRKGIPVAEGTGMSLAQYTFQKITIGVMGVVSFIILVLFGDRDLLKYTWFMLAGSIVISIICIFLFIITVSKKISDWVMKIARKLTKKFTKLYSKLDRAQDAIDHLQRQGKLVWKDTVLFVHIVLLDVAKFLCWYIIPGVIFVQSFHVNVFECLALMAVCNMIGCVMVAPSGIGTLDFVFAILFGKIIEEPEIVAATIVVYRFFTWLVPFVIGVFPAIFLKREKKTE